LKGRGWWGGCLGWGVKGEGKGVGWGGGEEAEYGVHVCVVVVGRRRGGYHARKEDHSTVCEHRRPARGAQEPTQGE
jgi:hypothetical protein